MVAQAGAGEPGAEDGLAFAAAISGIPARVDVGGIDEVKAALNEGVEHLEALFLVDGPAKDIAAQHERGNLVAGLGQCSFLHG